MTDTIDTAAKLPAILQHKKRHDWGLALLAWERDEKRGYLFEDGELRVLAGGFYDLMKEVDRPLDEVREFLERVLPQLEASSKQPGSKAQSGESSWMTFDDQLMVFSTEYPGGFADPDWSKKLRGEGVKKRLKRHRDAAIQEAQQKLAEAELAARMSQQQFRSVWDTVVAVLDGTDLVPSAQLKGLKTDDPEHLQALASSVKELLYGTGSFDTRLERYLSTHKKAFGESPGWQFATAIAALVHPTEHVCVRPNSFREQAKWMAPRISNSKSATVPCYARFLTMSRMLFEKLVESGHEPRDLMDVHDFVRLTTRPAAKKLALTARGDNAPDKKSAAEEDDSANQAA